jgi:Na+-transporting NADH:ubiquinone oxidoreductase subunit C
MSARLVARLRTVLFMAVATIIAVSAVSAVHLGTRERIRRNQSLFTQRAVLKAAGLTVHADDAATDAIFKDRVSERKVAGGRSHYVVSAPGSGRPIACVLLVRGAGLWGPIEAAVGFGPHLEKLTGVEFIAQNETPGLGGRITEEKFKRQFVGRSGPFALSGRGTGKEQEFDAVSGATITSRAVRDILNEAVRLAPRKER